LYGKTLGRLEVTSFVANRQFVCKPSVRLQTVSSFANRQFVCKPSVRLQTAAATVKLGK